jgi:hypothetical protein
MKRMIAVLLLLALPGVSSAGMLFPNHIETGGYGGVGARYSQLGDGEDGIFLGGGGGFVFNRQVTIGAELMVLVDDLPYTNLAGEDRFIEYTTANLRFGYVFWPGVIVHPALSFETGLGWMRLRNPQKTVDERDPDADSTFQMQPAAHIILNLTRTTRLSISGGYRWVSGIDTEDIADQDAEGAFADVAFSFGAF